MEKPKPARVLEVTPVAPRIDSLKVENALYERPAPGQFLMLWNGRDEKPMAPYAVERDIISIYVKRVGPFSESIREMEPGTLLGVRGPYGRGFDLSFQRPLLVGGGIGASPILYLASHLSLGGAKPDAFLGFNSTEDAICLDEFEDVSQVTFCTIDSSLGLPGMVTENLPSLEDFDCVYACGPEGMLVAVGKMAEKAGVECQLLVERYFKCGIGLCGSCQLGRHIVCKDGPVFFWRELRGTEFGRYGRDACGLRKPI